MYGSLNSITPAEYKKANPENICLNLTILCFFSSCDISNNESLLVFFVWKHFNTSEAIYTDELLKFSSLDMSEDL
jgi:hypothetical protein